VEALQLTRRRVWVYLCLGLLPLALIRVDNSGLLVTATFPILLACGCVLAKSADHSQSTLRCFLEIGSRSWIRIFLIGSAIPVALTVISIPVETVELNQLAQNQLSKNESGSATLFLSVFIVVCFLILISVVIVLRYYCFLWFFWTLCILPELSASKALDQALDGWLLNRFIVWPFAASSLLLFVTLFLPVLFVLWLAITTSMMYVSYRDIWMMKPKNQPAKARITTVKEVVNV